MKSANLKLTDLVAESQPALGKLVREGRLVVDATLAKRILDEAAYQRQRRIYPHHVRFLSGEMERGCFGQGSQLAFCLLNGRLILVNGYHRMTAIAASGLPQEFQVRVQPVASSEDVDRDYHQHDFGTRKRSVAEVLSAMDFAKRHGLSRTMARVVYEAALLLENNLARVNYQQNPMYRSVDYRVELAQKWVKPASDFEAALTRATPDIKSKLLRAGPAAVGIATFTYQQGKATDFWMGLAERDGLRRNDPRQSLSDDLLRRNMSQDSHDQGEKACAVAWNAFYEVRKLQVIKVYSDRPLKLLGTPWR